MFRKMFLLDLPPDHPNHHFIPAVQAMLMLLTLIWIFQIIIIFLKEYNYFSVMRRLNIAADHDRDAMATLLMVKEWALMSKEQKDATVKAVEEAKVEVGKVADKVEEVKTAVQSIPPSESGMSKIPTIEG